jgi:hypothetical protein
MLKISFSDTHIALEQLAATAEAVVAQRSILALRLGQSVYAQTGRGSLLLPDSMPGIATFLETVQGHEDITAATSEEGWLEISLAGIWIAMTATRDHGILLVNLGSTLEQQLIQLWQRSLSWVVEPSPLPKACR